MFGALVQGSTLYVLDKSDGNPKLKIATIESTTYPTGYSNMPWLQNFSGQTLDLSVAFADGEKVKFEKLPANLSVYLYDKAVVTETKELMQQQIESALRQSESVLESIPYHQKAKESYENLLKNLSPTYAKEKETDETIENLKSDIKSISKSLDNLTSMFAKMAKSSSEVSNSKKEQL